MRVDLFYKKFIFLLLSLVKMGVTVWGKFCFSESCDTPAWLLNSVMFTDWTFSPLRNLVPAILCISSIINTSNFSPTLLT